MIPGKSNSRLDHSLEEMKPIDREKVCPFLLRVFYNTGNHNAINEYSRSHTPVDELQIYTWKDATLEELTHLIREVKSDSRRKGTFFDFAIIFPDPRGPNCRKRDIGSTCAGKKGVDDGVTLLSKNFIIGDFLDVAITPPINSSGPRDMGRDGRRMRAF